MDRLSLVPLPAVGGGSRHDHMLRRFSRDPMCIVALREIGAGRTTVQHVVERVAAQAGAPVPEVTFHRGRGPHTGYCRQPRDRAVAVAGEGMVVAWEAERGPWPERGMIRLGDPTSLGTVAHELGHHFVNVFDPPRTASHGKAWVARFDRAAAEIAHLIRTLR